MSSRYIVVLWSLLGMLSIGMIAEAQTGRPSFRIETDLIFPKEKKPTKQTKTIFRDGVFYDFSIEQPSMVTVIDPAHKRIILLNREKKIQARVDMDQLRDLVEKAQQELTEQQVEEYLPVESGFVKDEATSEWVLATKSVEYRVKTEDPQQVDMARQYAEFADWTARLNGFYTDRPMPPYARLTLNRLLAEKGVLPKEIKRTTTMPDRSPLSFSGQQKITITSKILPIWILSDSDHSLADDAGTMMVEFQIVPIPEYINQQKIASQSAVEDAKKKR